MRFSLILISVMVSFMSFAHAANDDKVYTLRLATTWAEQVPFLGTAPATLAQTVETMSNGRLKIKIDSPNKHKSPFGVMDMVKAGQYDLAYTASYYYKGKDYKLVFFTTVPFGMLISEQYAWYNYGGGKELAEKVYSAHGLISYPMEQRECKWEDGLKKRSNHWQTSKA